MEFDKYFSWTKLKSIGKNRFSNSAYFWIVLIPLIVKIIQPLNRTLSFKILGADIAINLALPFSWKVFFLASIMFTVGNLLFQQFCPKIIRQYKDVRDYENEGRTTLTIKKAFISLLESRNIELDDYASINKSPYRSFLTLFYRSKEDTDYDMKKGRHVVVKTYETLANEDWRFLSSYIKDLKSAFWTYRELVNYDFIGVRYSCAFFYSIGLALVAIIILQNIIFVLGYLIDTGFF